MSKIYSSSWRAIGDSAGGAVPVPIGDQARIPHIIGHVHRALLGTNLNVCICTIIAGPAVLGANGATRAIVVRSQWCPTERALLRAFEVRVMTSTHLPVTQGIATHLRRLEHASSASDVVKTLQDLAPLFQTRCPLSGMSLSSMTALAEGHLRDRHESSRDALTGVLDAHAFADLFRAHAARTVCTDLTTHAPAVVLTLLDVGRFGLDPYAADLMRIVARLCVTHVACDDSLGRVGPASIAVLPRNCGAGGARSMRSRLIAACRAVFANSPAVRMKVDLRDVDGRNRDSLEFLFGSSSRSPSDPGARSRPVVEPKQPGSTRVELQVDWPSTGIATSQRSVLVVDDDADCREAFADVLYDAGYAVMMAREGRSALELLQASKQPPDLMLLDIMMPVLDGHGLLSELSKSERLAQIPTVVCTASDRPSAPWRNVRGFLRKPAHVDELLEAVVRGIAD